MQSRETQFRQKNNKNMSINSQNTAKGLPKVKNVIGESESIKILQQVERLLDNNQNLQGINLLTALKDNMSSVKNTNLHILTILNLGILYYQVGFLEQANEQLALVLQKLKQATLKLMPNRNKDMLRIKYETIMGKVELQICILYSQMGKHDIALQHARNSSKINFNIIYDLQTKLYSNLNKLLASKNYQKKDSTIELQQAKPILNYISILNHLLNGTKDLRLAFLQKEKLTILQEQTQLTRKYGQMPNKFDIELLYNNEQKHEHLWIYKNKILDEIQLTPFNHEHFEVQNQEITSNEIIEKIAFLAISLYCFSTETRFIEKQKNCDSHDVLDSEHWLSRSLEIAYSFMPAEAPILNQILTVHDRFHGLDKQTIPEDEQVSGFFKVLKPLSKPKSLYNTKNPGCSPIMIRIQADKVDLQFDQPSKTHRDMTYNKNLMELDDQDKTSEIELMVKNNKMRGYSHGHKRIETFDVNKNRFLSSRATIDNSMYAHGNIRDHFINKKFTKKRQDKLKVNFSELHGKALISEDLLSKPENANKFYIDQQLRSASQRKKKSFSLRKHEQTKKMNNTNVIKIGELGGLELKGHRLEESLQNELYNKINSNKGVMQTTRMGGNVYINNNINLYISKVNDGSFGQTFIRGQVIHDKNKEQNLKDKEMSRRQIFLNKRRANNFTIDSEQL